MSVIASIDRLRVHVNRLRQQLWVRPLAIGVLSVAGAFVARIADETPLAQIVPTITSGSIVDLLSIMAASMLVIATFAVASMVSAYASASSSATPRAFTLVVADDVSQNALSTFIGAFIYSIVALIAMKNSLYDKAGVFVLFVLTVIVFSIVIVTFVRWVDRIARLGRLGMTINKVEQATADAFHLRRNVPTLGGVPLEPQPKKGRAVYAKSVGYVQHIDMESLQDWADKVQGKVVVNALPGTFAAPGRSLACVSVDRDGRAEIDVEQVAQSFMIGGERQFEDDPRFGLVVLSEIAGRALSPAVNDPGTAIGVIGTLVRLFVLWSEPTETEEVTAPQYDRVEVPEISVRDMFDDAFTAIARDGAGAVEVSVRLQKALWSLASIDDVAIRGAAEHHARLALARAEKALDFPGDLTAVREATSIHEGH